MKRTIYILLVGMFFINTFVAIAQEGGWKDLKWGMSLQEIVKIYVDEETGKKCEGMRSSPVSRIPYNEIDYFSDDELQGVNEIYCSNTSDESGGSGILLYKGKFFGKIVKINISEKEIHEELIKLLKEKYPKGKVLRGGRSHYQVFNYTSDSIKIFNTSEALYFYNPIILNKILNDSQKLKQQEEDQKKQKLKKLF